MSSVSIVSALSNGSNDSTPSHTTTTTTNTNTNNTINHPSWTPTTQESAWVQLFDQAFVGDMPALFNITMAARSNEVINGYGV
jgi:hypothetical protein